MSSFQLSTYEDSASDPIKIDLPAYASNYSGYIKFQRLMFIAEQCPSLKNEALILAHDYVKKFTLDTESYNKIFVALSGIEEKGEPMQTGDDEISPEDRTITEDISGDVSSVHRINCDFSVANEAGLVYDAVWVRNTRSKGRTNLDVLDTELQNAKANLIKEYIRKHSGELGDLYLNMGQLENAIKYYNRSRDYCTSRQQDLNTCLNIIKVAVYQSMWSHVSAYVTRAETLCDLEEQPKANIGSGWPGEVVDVEQQQPQQQTNSGVRNAASFVKSQLAIAGGLVKLANSSFRDAATCFLQAHCDAQDDAQGNLFVTPSDLAFYVTLCSLATFDRAELKSQVLSSPSFRMILESEMQCRDVLTAFHQADYATCLNLLGRLKKLLRLDLFISGHVVQLFRAIRTRALCQYFTPYLSANMNDMATAFGTNVTQLENELAKLIQDGHIKARIDSHKQLLCALNVDQRCSTFSNALRVADEFRCRCQAAILRSNLLRHSLISTQFLSFDVGPKFSGPSALRPEFSDIS